MTPQLMQAIKLLALSNLDLTAYVEGELEKNPLLERATDSEQAAADSDAEPFESGAAGDAPSGDGSGAEPIGSELETSRGAIEERLGTDLENVFPDEAGQSSAQPGVDSATPYSEWAVSGAHGSDDSAYNLESFVSATPTLAEHLAEQLALADTDPIQRMIGQYLIDMIDEAGYLVGDLASVADKLGATLPQVEEIGRAHV